MARRASGRALAVVLLRPARMSRRRRPDRPSTRYEIFLGRSLAICAHPVAAWRTTAKKRMVLFAGYFTAAYLTVFALMALLS